MKITRKQLRQIILESILKEDLTDAQISAEELRSSERRDNAYRMGMGSSPVGNLVWIAGCNKSILLPFKSGDMVSLESGAQGEYFDKFTRQIFDYVIGESKTVLTLAAETFFGPEDLALAGGGAVARRASAELFKKIIPYVGIGLTLRDYAQFRKKINEVSDNSLCVVLDRMNSSYWASESNMTLSEWVSVYPTYFFSILEFCLNELGLNPRAITLNMVKAGWIDGSESENLREILKARQES